MGFQNKRIMFVCQEGYSYPFYFLSEKWKKNNKLAAFFIILQKVNIMNVTITEILITLLRS